MHGVDCVIDVRSIPYSKYTPEFNKNNLYKKLDFQKICYRYLGNKLGGRYSNPNLFSAEGFVDYKKVRQRAEFKEGIQEIIKLIQKGRRVTLMCMEKEPFDCHRFVLISYSLTNDGINVEHILENGELISNKDLENRLFKMYGQKKLFDAYGDSKENELEKYYEKRNWDIGYSIHKETQL
ncbi:MAG: DUF488 domain-containing protein [Methanosarcinaceae archaeon]|nr:DUF488 domain-containing protein [Methanosarcinaceae archaeon]